VDKMNRRQFLRRATAVGAVPALAVAEGLPVLAAAEETAGKGLELPPANAEVFNTTCQYCMVQCGYKVYVPAPSPFRTSS